MRQTIIISQSLKTETMFSDLCDKIHTKENKTLLLITIKTAYPFCKLI